MIAKFTETNHKVMTAAPGVSFGVVAQMLLSHPEVKLEMSQPSDFGGGTIGNNLGTFVRTAQTAIDVLQFRSKLGDSQATRGDLLATGLHVATDLAGLAGHVGAGFGMPYAGALIGAGYVGDALAGGYLVARAFNKV